MSTASDDSTLFNNTIGVSSIAPATNGNKRSGSDDFIAAASPAAKRSFLDGERERPVGVKILIPEQSVGALMGKGGETLRRLKKETDCNIVMSKPYAYQNTNERVCTVRGKLAGVLGVIDAILLHMRDKCTGLITHGPHDIPDVMRARQIKFIVPQSAAGLVIGKAGARIKEIRDETGCQAQIFPKPGAKELHASPDRVITVGGEQTEIVQSACARVLERIACDPHHTSLIEADENLATATTVTGAQPWLQHGSERFDPLSGMSNMETISFLDSLSSVLRNYGFGDAANAEIMQAMQVLAKYNIMSLGLGLGVAAVAQMRGPTGAAESQMMSSTYSLFEPTIRHSPSTEVVQQSSLVGELSSDYAASVIKERTVTVVSENGLGPGADVLELEMPDLCVGAVLGPRAKTLQEIQTSSGANVKVHKREAPQAAGLTPGRRIIHLEGSAEAVRHARTLIERVINEAHFRRSNNNAAANASIV